MRLEIDKLSVASSGDVSGESLGERARLSDVSFSLNTSERLCLVGPNGSGKTTLLRFLAGLETGEFRDLRCDGTNLRAATDIAGVVYIPQDADDGIVCSTVWEDVTFGPCNLGLAREEVIARARDALATCGLVGFENCSVQTLSGGQKQLLVLAAGLACRPQILLLDEPCSMLDDVSRLELLHVLERLSKDLITIHATHRLEDVFDYDKCLILESGRCVCTCTPCDVVSDKALAARSHVLIPGWLQNLPAENAEKTSADLMEDFRFKRAQILGRALVERLSFMKVPPKRTALQDRAGAAGHSRALCLRDVSFKPRKASLFTSLAGESDTVEETSASFALRDCTLSVNPGELVVLCGRTGAGKTTLALLSCGVLAPDEGEILVGADKVSVGQVAYAFQRPQDQIFKTNVLDEVAWGPRQFGLSKTEAVKRAKKALELVGLPDLDWSHINPFRLSCGQIRRVGLASVLALESALYIFDEPTAGLDSSGVIDFLRVLEAIRACGAAVLVLTHDIEVFAASADAIYVLEAGKLGRFVPGIRNDLSDRGRRS